MNETKKCPYCGEEILAVAKKCKYCGEWLEEAKQPIQVCEAQPSKDDTIKKTTPEQTAKPESFYINVKKQKSKIFRHISLQEFKFENGIVSITTQNGKSFSAPLEEIITQIYDRNWRDLIIKSGKQKVSIREYGDLLGRKEWDTIEKILDNGKFDDSNFWGLFDSSLKTLKALIICVFAGGAGFGIFKCSGTDNSSSSYETTDTNNTEVVANSSTDNADSEVLASTFNCQSQIEGHPLTISGNTVTIDGNTFYDESWTDLDPKIHAIDLSHDGNLDYYITTSGAHWSVFYIYDAKTSQFKKLEGEDGYELYVTSNKIYAQSYSIPPGWSYCELKITDNEITYGDKWLYEDPTSGIYGSEVNEDGEITPDKNIDSEMLKVAENFKSLREKYQ